MPLLDQIIRELRQSPLFQLSLSSKELFHSNFLAWLCERYPNQAGEIFGPFSPQQQTRIEKVYREKNHVDLTLAYSDGAELIVENKVKSLATLEQLATYMRGKDLPKTRFLLLSLMRPPFASGKETTIALNGGDWRYLSYGELADRLRKALPHVVTRNDYHGALLEDYLGFITQLDALQSYFVANWDHETDFFAVEKDLHRLKGIRMHDVIERLRYAHLVGHTAAILKDNNFQVAYSDFPDGQEGQISVAAGMTRGVGLFDLKYVVMNIEESREPVILGVQVQGRQFRLVVEMVKGTTQARAIAKGLLSPAIGSRIWFDFEPIPKESRLDEYPKDGGFNKYGNNFFYRYSKLTSIAPQKVVDTIVGYVNLIQRNKKVLQEQIQSALHEQD